jgi:hypothetical protein
VTPVASVLMCRPAPRDGGYPGWHQRQDEAKSPDRPFGMRGDMVDGRRVERDRDQADEAVRPGRQDLRGGCNRATVMALGLVCSAVKTALVLRRWRTPTILQPSNQLVAAGRPLHESLPGHPGISAQLTWELSTATVRIRRARCKVTAASSRSLACSSQ